MKTDRERLLIVADVSRRIVEEHPQKLDHFANEVCCFLATVAVGDRHPIDESDVRQFAFRLFMVAEFPQTAEFFRLT